MTQHAPRRRCVGCGRVAPKSELLRIAASREGAGTAARAVLDRQAVMPGRGAYLCADGSSERPDRQCLALALQRGGIARGLRRAVTLDALTADPEPLESVG